MVSSSRALLGLALDFCLHKLLEMRKSVCYFYGKDNSAIIFKPDGTVEEYKIADNHGGALASEVDFLLIDPPENGDANFLGGCKGLKKKKFILAVSPDRNNCQAIRKDTSTIELYGDLLLTGAKRYEGNLL